MGAILFTCRDRAYAEAFYVPALRAAGWNAPVLVVSSLEHPGAEAAPLLEGVDGVLLTGGGDIHPRQWDPEESVHPAAEVHEDRDALELPLVRAAWERGLPLFGICRGAQILNVALGGSLIQDIPDHFACTPEVHQHGTSEKPDVHHAVDVLPESLLARALGATSVRVNSRHHQAIRRVAPGLRAVAFDPATRKNGEALIEGVESNVSGPWALGVQWHPENLVTRQDLAGTAARGLFRAFLDAVASVQDTAG